MHVCNEFDWTFTPWGANCFDCFLVKYWIQVDGFGSKDNPYITNKKQVINCCCLICIMVSSNGQLVSTGWYRCTATCIVFVLTPNCESQLLLPGGRLMTGDTVLVNDIHIVQTESVHNRPLPSSYSMSVCVCVCCLPPNTHPLAQFLNLTKKKVPFKKTKTKSSEPVLMGAQLMIMPGWHNTTRNVILRQSLTVNWRWTPLTIEWGWRWRKTKISHWKPINHLNVVLRANCRPSVVIVIFTCSIRMVLILVTYTKQ